MTTDLRRSKRAIRFNQEDRFPFAWAYRTRHGRAFVSGKLGRHSVSRDTTIIVETRPTSPWPATFSIFSLFLPLSVSLPFSLSLFSTMKAACLVRGNVVQAFEFWWSIPFRRLPSTWSESSRVALIDGRIRIRNMLLDKSLVRKILFLNKFKTSVDIKRRIT